MSPKNRTSLLLETLEDRVTPSLTYTMDSFGDLSVTGTTPNNVTITSTAAGVTIMNGASSALFTVMGNLTVNISFTSAPTPLTPQLSYSPGVAASGAVSLTDTSFLATTANPTRVYVTGPAGTVNVNGLLTVNTNALADYVAVEGVNPAGFNHNGGGGADTVTVGYNVDNATTGAVTVRGHVQVVNVNQIGFGAEPTGPAVVVQGITSVSTHNTPGITFANPNDLDVAPETILQGTLAATMNGPFEAFTTQGEQDSNVILQFGNGGISSFVEAGMGVTSKVFGNITETFAPGAFTSGIGGLGVDFNGIVGGNISLVMGNGPNQVSFNQTQLGGSVSYHGGNGGDNVTWYFTANAPNAALQFIFGAGNDTFTVDNSNFKSLYADGGFGTNTLITAVPIASNMIFRNF